MGENVKIGRLMNKMKLNLQETAFKDFTKEEREIHVFSTKFLSKLEDNLFHECCHHIYETDFPSTIFMWYALDALMNASGTCVTFLHCMETHVFYHCGEIPYWPLDMPARNGLPMDSFFNFTDIAQAARDYLDREIEWYYDFLPPNSRSIFMSDHGGETDLTELNINMPFKVMGKGISSKLETRLFSYTNLNKLIEKLFHSEMDLDGIFSDNVMIDVIEPYDKEFGINIQDEMWDHMVWKRQHLDKKFLVKYLQTTKVVSAAGEYYTINILGEETYYRDKECKINLIDNPAYADRIAELREKAGKFYNPWKEKRQVAIDFYEYLGIEEKDILAQCY